MFTVNCLKKKKIFNYCFQLNSGHYNAVVPKIACSIKVFYISFSVFHLCIFNKVV